MSLASKRAALRIARRTAQRSKGRSILVLSMVGLPVLAVVMISVLVRTADPSNADKARRAIGAADALVTFHHDGEISQDEHGSGWSPVAGAEMTAGSGPPRPSNPAIVRRLLPAGSQVVERRQWIATRARTAAGAPAQIQQMEIDLSRSMTAGLTRRVSGRLPAKADEVLATAALLERTGARVGGQVQTVKPDRTYTIVGTAVLPDALRERYLIGLPGALVEGDDVVPELLVDLPDGVDVGSVMPALNKNGWLVQPRSTWLNPPELGGTLGAEQVGVALVVAGLAMLEVILLAGAAFAVGARRQRRELGLVAATGGDRSHVRSIVLGGGVVIGTVAAIVGVVGGVAAAAGLAPVLERRLSPALFGEFEVRPFEVALIALLGFGTALLAAVLPAKAAARQPVVDALTGRRGQVRSSWRLTIPGLVAIGAGALLAARGAKPPAHFNLILAGAVIAELGFVACSPAVVGLAGRLAGAFPLPIRLALRDSARHRGRSGPAVAAVMAALAGTVALSVYLTSEAEKQRAQYEPTMHPGQVTAYVEREGGLQPAALDAVAVKLPTRAVLPLVDASGCSPAGCQAVRVRIPSDAPDGCVITEGAARCDDLHSRTLVGVGDDRLVRAMVGSPHPDAEAVLARGGIVVTHPAFVVDGHATVQLSREDDPDGAPPLRTVRLPAVAVNAPEASWGPLARAVISPATATRHGLPTQSGNTVLFDTTRVPTEKEVDAAVEELSRFQDHAELQVERGFESDTGLALIILLAVSGAVTLGASVIATGLAAADGRPDLATLAAVGASPRVRRLLSMSQAATVALLGSILGVIAGLVPAVAVINARDDWPLVIPWPTLAAAVVAVPTVIALLAGLFTRSRLPLERRLA